MNAVENLRHQVISELMGLGTMEKVWPIWQEDIQSLLNGNITPNNTDLISLGNGLYDIFRQTTDGSRSQGEVAGGGAAWEGLVCWYLNLCLLGSNTVVIKAKKKNTPKVIFDAISVNYGNFKSNTESDLLAITFPNNGKLNNDFDGNHDDLMQLINTVTSDFFTETELSIIQCKTNWNDNAQIPMLWDLIYSSEGFSSGTTVGSNGYSHKRLKKFSYAFATVPTVDPEKIRNTSTCVQRVHHLSGGNYWGRPSKTGVAMNIFDMLNRNFHNSLNSYTNSWHIDISKHIKTMYNEGNNYFQL